MKLVNKKGKPFTWSFSSLNEFLTCPNKYAAKRFYCDVSDPPTVHTEWGTRVHLALEERVRDKKPLPEGMGHWEKWAAAIENANGEIFCERQICLDRNLEPTGWFDEDAWCRGVIDVLIIQEDKATLIDYKTGKKKSDDTQLVLFSGMISLLYPEIDIFNYKYIWLKEDTTTGGTTDRKRVVEELHGSNGVLDRVKRMEKAWEDEDFPCSPSGLCRGWCPVESCIHWRPKR